jgi:RNA polymerase sigma-70 factor (ECF subfamily)
VSNWVSGVINDVSDEGLVGRAKQGDLEAYSELVRRHRERVYRTVLRFTRDHGDADDLAQETFLRAFREIRRFREKAGFSTWLYRIAVNLSLNHLKREKREMGRQEFVESFADRQPAPGFSPESAFRSAEFQARLNDAVDSLPPAYKTSFVLVVYEGMSHGQAARILGCSENTVSWRLHKARKMLQAKLLPILGEVSR